MSNPSEVLRLAIALAMLPIAVSLTRQVRRSDGRLFYGVAVSAIYLSMMMSVIEESPGMPQALLNNLQHWGYGIAGVFAAVGAYQTRAGALRDRAGI